MFLAASLALVAAFPARGAEPLKVVSLDSKFYEFPLDYAQKEGFFARAGVSVERSAVARGVVAQVVSGQADAALVSVAQVLAAFGNGAPLRVVAVLYPRYDYYAVSRFPAAQAARIKTVALNSPGAASRQLLEPFYAHLKLDEASLSTVIAPGDAARLALLERGEADLTNVSSPQLLRKIRQEGKLHLIPASVTGRAGEASVVAVSSRAYASRGEDIERFISALHDAIAAAAADKAKARRRLVADHGYSAEEADAFSEAFSSAAASMDFVPSAAGLGAAFDRLGRDAPRKRGDLGALAAPEAARKAVEKARRGR